MTARWMLLVLGSQRDGVIVAGSEAIGVTA